MSEDWKYVHKTLNYGDLYEHVSEDKIRIVYHNKTVEHYDRHGWCKNSNHSRKLPYVYIKQKEI